MKTPFTGHELVCLVRGSARVSITRAFTLVRVTLPLVRFTSAAHRFEVGDRSASSMIGAFHEKSIIRAKTGT